MNEILQSFASNTKLLIGYHEAKEAEYNKKTAAFEALCVSKTAMIELEKVEWETEKNKMKKLQKFQSCVKLNVGGLKFETSLETLLSFPDSMLGVMFSGKYANNMSEDGYYFIDRDGTHFRFILNFLRNPEDFVCDLTPLQKEELKCEADFYGLKDEMFPVFIPAADSVIQDRDGLSVNLSQDELGVWRGHKWTSPNEDTTPRCIEKKMLTVCRQCKTGQLKIFAEPPERFTCANKYRFNPRGMFDDPPVQQHHQQHQQHNGAFGFGAHPNVIRGAVGAHPPPVVRAPFEVFVFPHFGVKHKIRAEQAVCTRENSCKKCGLY